MDSPAPVLLFHAVPPPLAAALAEQGLTSPAFRIVAKPDAAMPTGIVLSGHDPNLPALLAAWRAEGLHAPVLLLGAGAEDWEVTETLPLPVRLGALLARLRYYLNLRQGLAQNCVSWQGHMIDGAQKLIQFGAVEQVLTEKETAILLLLAESAQPWSRDDLLREIWGYDASIDTHTLETHIYRLRRKLAALAGGGDIVTTPNGYLLSCATP